MECPECGKEIRGMKCRYCGFDTRPPKALPKKPVKCCSCGKEVDRAGWCAECLKFPQNIIPRRECGRGHIVDSLGFCWTCKDYVLSRLEYMPSGWNDTRVFANLLDKKENQKRGRDLAGTLGGPGWPEIQVPLNVRHIPKRWKKLKLNVVGMTPNGDEIVIPA